LPYDTADDRQRQLEAFDGLDPLSEMRLVVHIGKGRRDELGMWLADDMAAIFDPRTMFRFPASGSMAGCILGQNLKNSH
jgi:hypothetical protein